MASPVELLRNSQTGANVFPGVPPEFTNWRDEQRAWQTTCLLFDQSFHMNDLRVRGPDALGLLTHLGVNSFDGWAFDRAKHFVPCTPDGYVIGDVILFPLAEEEFNLVGRAPALNWITYHAETGGYDVELELDLRTALRTDGRRRSYRFQLQGPNAMQVTENVLRQAPPDLRFFHTTTVTIAGKTVGALRHGMVGQPGWELFGPWEDREAVLEALLAAGEDLGLLRSGARAYSSNTVESGWIPSPLPAVYSGASLIGTHGSSGTPYSCNNSTVTFVTDAISLPEVNTAARANTLFVRVYVRNSSSRKSVDDVDTVSVTYSLD